MFRYYNMNVLLHSWGELCLFGCVVLDRLHAKEAIKENADHKEFKNETTGGLIIIAKTNRVRRGYE